MRAFYAQLCDNVRRVANIRSKPCSRLPPPGSEEWPSKSSLDQSDWTLACNINIMLSELNNLDPTVKGWAHGELTWNVRWCCAAVGGVKLEIKVIRQVCHFQWSEGRVMSLLSWVIFSASVVTCFMRDLSNGRPDKMIRTRHVKCDVSLSYADVAHVARISWELSYSWLGCMSAYQGSNYCFELLYLF